MNEVLKTMKPEKIWYFFGEILKIPRASKKEEKIRTYLKNFGTERNLETIEDNTGNILIRKAATKGMEKKKGVILQSHMDMVCEKNSDSKHNFDTDPIEILIQDQWMKAKETTLGADNGIGVAAALAILDSDDIVHGPLECLFTVDEETGLSGAFGLEAGFLKGNILLNLDSEDDGQFFIGCAGGVDTLITYPYQREARSENFTIGLKIIIKGLKGGHSGDDINKGLGNANKLLTRLLFALNQNINFGLDIFDGGNLRNAIAREAFAKICIAEDDLDFVESTIKEYEEIFQKELKTTEPHLVCSLEKDSLAKQILQAEYTDALLNALYACPHGCLRMSADIPNFVETSTNLASVKTLENEIKITTSQRSSVSSAKFDAANMVASCFMNIGAKIEHSDGYPGWNPNPNAPIIHLIKKLYKQRFAEEPLFLAIHAGLECGLFEEKYPQLDMVSYGPTMRGVHSPDERLEIPTVEKFWDLTLDILRNIEE